MTSDRVQIPALADKGWPNVRDSTQESQADREFAWRSGWKSHTKGEGSAVRVGFLDIQESA